MANCERKLAQPARRRSIESICISNSEFLCTRPSQAFHFLTSGSSLTNSHHSSVPSFGAQLGRSVALVRGAINNDNDYLSVVTIEVGIRFWETLCAEQVTVMLHNHPLELDPFTLLPRAPLRDVLTRSYHPMNLLRTDYIPSGQKDTRLFAKSVMFAK